jgi:quinol monooxygenase YgiN
MHARITTLCPKDGQKERVIRICEDVVTPVAEKQKGFCGFLLMSENEVDDLLGVTLWDTEADMLATERGEYLQEQISHVIHFLAGPPLIRHRIVDVMF